MAPRSRGLERAERASLLRLVGGAHPATPEALVEQGEHAERDERWELARDLYERALHQLDARVHGGLVASLLLAIGRTHRATGNPDAALDCVEAALAGATEREDATGQGYALNLRALVAWEQGDYEAAERDHQAAREAARKAGDARLAAIAARHLGALAVLRGDLDEAAREYEASLAEFRVLGAAADVCTALAALGDVYADQGRWEPADRALSEAAQIAGVLGDLEALFDVELRRADGWLARAELDEARRAYDRAADLSRRLREPRAQAQLARLAGVLAREVGEFELAHERLEAAERQATELQDLVLAAEAARERAELHRRQERHGDTLQALNRAWRMLSRTRGRASAVEIGRRTARLEREFLEVVRRWGQSIEAKDLATQGHCERVADLSVSLAARMGVDRRSLFWYRVGALLHDVGKLVVPPEILNKPGRLSEEEWSLVKRHPAAGAEMLQRVDFPWEVRPIVESHHECWDGSGYPHGLAGDAIPLAARIVTVADVYDVLTSERSFKRALPHAEAMEVMRRDVGRQFDPAVFRAFEELVAESPMPGAGASATTAAVATTTGGAREDALTRTLHRAAFFAAATSALAARRGSTRPVSLLLVDVDDFARVNEAGGRAQGDDVLWAVARVLQSGLRGIDVVGRYGGDEFAILLPDAPPEKAREIAQRLADAVARLVVPARDGSDASLRVTVSVGCATAPRHGDTTATLVAAANRALFEARTRGPGSVLSAEEGAPVAPAVRLVFDRFVGRAEELRRLTTALDRSARGDPRVVFVTGEGGVGKSTLVRELEPEIRLRAGVLAVANAREGAIHTPLAPWADVLAVLRAQGLAPATAWSALPRLLPALAGDERAAATVDRQQLFDELVAFLAAASRLRPLVVVLEDAHWADASTWDAIEHVVERVGGRSVMLIVTLRAEAARSLAARRRRLSRDARVEQIPLRRLAAEELKRWLETVFHQGDIGPELPAFLHEHTEGNPLLVQQVLRTLADDGAIWYAGTRWEWNAVQELRLPGTAARVLEHRLERLSPRARRIVATASILGDRFDAATLQAAGAGSDAEIAAALAEARASGVVDVVAGTPGDRFAFRHALLAEAARRAIPERARQRLHEATARALELRAPTAVAEIAGHYHAAGNAAKAHDYALLAAERAASIYAHDEAAAALQVAQQHAPSADALAETRRRLAALYEHAGRLDEAESMCDLALEYFAAHPDPARALPLRRLRERLHLVRGVPPQRVFERCRALLLEAESHGEREESGWLLIMLSRLRGRMLDAEGAERFARRAVRVAEMLPVRGLQAEALLRLGVAIGEASPTESLARYREALALFSRLGDRHGQLRCWIQTAVTHARAGYLAAAREAIAVAHELGRQAHAPELTARAALHAGVLATQAGDYGDARARLEEARTLFASVRHAPHELLARLALAHLEREEGHQAAAVAGYESAATEALGVGMWDVALSAEAGAALVRLARDAHDPLDRWTRVVRTVPPELADVWFPGRELVEALLVRLALRDHQEQDAIDAFAGAMERASRHDAWAAAWLAAACAQPLADAGLVTVSEQVAPHAARAGAAGYAALTARFEAFRHAALAPPTPPRPANEGLEG